MLLTGKTAVVTGGSRGIGRAIALEMANEGADIAIFYAGGHEAAKQTAEKISSIGRRAKVYMCDVGSYEDTKKQLGIVLEDFGGVDILVNNAGIVKDGPVPLLCENDFDRVIETNLKGAFNMIRHLYPHFIKKHAGRIINIASVAGIAGSAGQANYSAAKAGMIGLTKSVAKELAGRGVTCNAIAPGYIKTDMTDALPEKVREAALAAVPMKRMGEPDDVAAMAVFLASDKAKYLTGEVIKIDGGLYM